MPDEVMVNGSTRWVRATEPYGDVRRMRRRGVRYECPCCYYPTLRERGGDEICFLCSWQDNGQDDPLADEISGGPNGNDSLSQARRNFRRYRNSLAPKDSGQPDTPWQIEMKERAIAAFKEMKHTTDKTRIRVLWRECLREKDALYREMVSRDSGV